MATGPVKLPPFPANSPPGSWAWVDWWKRLQDFVSSITSVAAENTLQSAPTTGIPGYTTIDVPWVVIGNYVQFDIQLNITGSPLVTTDAIIDFVTIIPGQVPPAPIQDGLCYMSAYKIAGTPYVQSLGIGYISQVGGSTKVFLPDFATAAGFDRVHITGRYNIS